MFLQVQLLYSDPSLGARVEFLIKRLEILQVNMPMSSLNRYLFVPDGPS